MDAKMMFSSCLVVGVAVLFSLPCECSKILFISNIPSVSHSMWQIKLVELMLNRGHEVVVVDVEPKKFDHQNYTHYHMEDAYVFFDGFSAAVESGEIKMESVVEDYSVIDNINFMTNIDIMGCRNILFGNGFQTFLKDYKGSSFDLLVFDVGCEAFFGLSTYFPETPYIVTTPYSDPVNILDASAALYDNPSYVPTPFTLYQSKMTIFEKIQNIFYKLYYLYRVHIVLNPQLQQLAEETFGKSVGDIEELIRNVTLTLYVNNLAMFDAKPIPPSLIGIAGVHIDPVNPLPKDIKNFMDGAKDGVIFFSLGSNLKSVTMSEKNVKMFLDVFKDLPQRIVWKLETNDTSMMPKNVYASKWLPQNDILGHPKVRCFIAHGGLSGIQEAIYHGVPVLGLPFLIDQVSVIDRLEKDGAAIHLRYQKLSEKYFREKLMQILEDKSYTLKMKEKSNIFRDSPLTPKEAAVYWMEYVIRHSKELHYLKPPSVHMHWYERLLLDVAAVMILLVCVSLYIIMKIISRIKSVIFPKKMKKE